MGASLTGSSPIGLAMLAFARALILHHREGAAVFTTSALFLAGTLPLVWVIG